MATKIHEDIGTKPATFNQKGKCPTSLRLDTFLSSAIIMQTKAVPPKMKSVNSPYAEGMPKARAMAASLCMVTML